MMKLKLISALVIAGLITAPAVFGQQRQSDREMSVEESYLQDAIEMMIIRETVRSDSRDQKLIALEYISNALERGNTGDEIRMSLEFLALEGTVNRATENKRLINDYPDIRRIAARYLGQINTVESKVTLIRLCAAEREPMVLMEAIRSLGEIDAGESADAVTVIVWVFNRFNVSFAPDALLALSAIEALDKIAERSNGIRDPAAFQLLGRISEGLYPTAVKERARKALSDMRRYTAQNQDTR
jgi:HEAT repeat protein